MTQSVEIGTISMQVIADREYSLEVFTDGEYRPGEVLGVGCCSSSCSCSGE